MKKRAGRATSLKKNFFRKVVEQITNATDEELREFLKSEAELGDDEARVMSVLATDEIARRASWKAGIW